jgi:hypothetical protein
MPGGRPTKYKKKYCTEIIEFMAEGYTATAFAGHIGVNFDTICEWTKQHPEFSEARKQGQAACEKYLITMGKGLMTGRIKGNPTPWIFMMKNICGWRDKQDLTIRPGFDDIDDEDVKLLKAVDRTILIEAAKKGDK